LGGGSSRPAVPPLLLRIVIYRRRYRPLVPPRRGPAVPVGQGGEASLYLGPGVLADWLVAWVAVQVKADGMIEDGAAIGGTQLPHA
jgi:hypothetical protein